MTGFHDNDVGSAAAWAVFAALALWVAGRLGLPANVRVFILVVAGFVVLMASAHLIDTVWLTVKRRRNRSGPKTETTDRKA